MYWKHVVATLATIAIISPAAGYDRNLPFKTCKKLFPQDKAEREKCVTKESVMGAAMDDLAAGNITDEQYGILQTCRSNYSDSYSGQIQCVQWFLDTKDAEFVCERARQAGDGSYQTKEACIKAELEAKARLGN